MCETKSINIGNIIHKSKFYCNFFKDEQKPLHTLSFERIFSKNRNHSSPDRKKHEKRAQKQAFINRPQSTFAHTPDERIIFKQKRVRFNLNTISEGVLLKKQPFKPLFYPTLGNQIFYDFFAH